MKTLLGLLTLMISVQCFADPIDCRKPKDLKVSGEYCSISYRTLAILQEMQINGKVAADLDIASMEKVLLSGAITTEELKPDLWAKASIQAKANKSFKLMLEHTQQLELYLQFTIDSAPMPELAMGGDGTSSTGTRGGGFGKETYILPDGFWIK